jgi:two-component system, chemotaxis family, CheB/CheR fusion protein
MRVLKKTANTSWNGDVFHQFNSIMELKSVNNRNSQSNLAQSETFIIGIGASAGGMDAIHELFDHTPTDAVSYVIVQHLSPDHKSFMKELLVKHSKLKIYVAEDGMEVVSNFVYILPEGKTMTISGGRLMLKERQGSKPNSAIDIFFNSLAEDQGNKSIAIVLSGNGSDGTRGIEAIKKVGGMVIVQDPQSSDFDGMPQNAIDSGYYDYILAPKLIPLQIIKYVQQKTLASNFSHPLSEANEAALLEINSLIKNHTPLDFTEYKRPTIIRRITRRMVANNTDTIGDYIELLKTNPSEIDILSKEFLISVTNFFRNPEAFDVMAKKVIPELVGNKLLVDVLKVWVIGCATGEEAYSLAILIREHLIEVKKDIEVKIFASDIDKEALAKASKACYPKSISKHVSESRLNNFFIEVGDEYKVRDNIRKMIIFAEHDIIHQPPYGKIDLISCRNMMIYFNPTLQTKIFTTLNFCLNTDGYLFLGPSEGLGSLKSLFTEVDKKWKIYKNTEHNNKAQFKAYAPQHLEVKKHPYPSLALKTLKINYIKNLPELLNKSTLEEAGFLAGVCVDENNKVILPFGDFEKYLLPKLFNSNLLELLPAELAIAAATSIKKAIKENAKVTVQGITFKVDEAIRSVDILVKPLVNEKLSNQKIILLYFAEGERKGNTSTNVEVFNREAHTQRYLSDLELELAETKKSLQEAHEFLEESNSNIQSYNEELLSGNEEMQSSNEELQSINEELNTVNLEYQLKIKELADLNDDLDNYFKSTHITQIYVDNNIIIKKYNPLTIKHINIKESDVGRPLADISTNIKFSSLIEDIKFVIDTQQTKEKPIETTDGRWYSMMIVPYIRSQDNRADGAVITFNDISEITESKKIIQETNRKLVEINKEHDTFIYSAYHDLKAPLNNMEGLLYLIKSTDDLEEIKSIMLPLVASVIRLKETISELSDITKIEREIEEAEKIDVGKLLEEVKMSINDLFTASNAKINVDFEENEISFSRKNLRSIFFNLLSNALKYRSPDRPLEVIIKSRRVNGSVLLSFEDNGIGIKPANIPEIFSKFRRVHDKKITAEGAGIGLYLVKKIVANAGGEIKVESNYGQGSRFTIVFNNSAAEV